MITSSIEKLVSYDTKASASGKSGNGIVESLYHAAARLDRVGFAMLRLGLVVVL